MCSLYYKSRNGGPKYACDLFAANNKQTILYQMPAN